MGLFSEIFGGDKVKDSLFDKEKGLAVRAGQWVDHMNFTAEEKAKYMFQVQELTIERLKALAPFKVVQRILAFFVSFTWAFVILNVLVGIWVEAFVTVEQVVDGQVVEKSPTLVAPMLELAFSSLLLWPVGAVLSLYFTGGILPDRWKKN